MKIEYVANEEEIARSFRRRLFFVVAGWLFLSLAVTSWVVANRPKVARVVRKK